MKSISLLASVLCLLVLMSPVSAQILTVEPSTEVSMDGYFVSDCFLDSAGTSWLSGVFYCELESGVLYQDPAYSITTALNWTCIPGLNEEDSWLAPGVSYFADGNEMAPLSGFSGDPADAAASICFIPTLVDNTVPPWDGLVSRFVFSEDAEGTWAFKVARKDDDDSGWISIQYSGIIGLYDGPIPGDLDEGFVDSGADLDAIQPGQMMCAGTNVLRAGSNGGSDPGDDDPGDDNPGGGYSGGGDTGVDGNYIPEPGIGALLLLLAAGGMGRWFVGGRG